MAVGRAMTDDGSAAGLDGFLANPLQAEPGRPKAALAVIVRAGKAHIVASIATKS
jgi:hypothetical protein